MRDLEVLDVLGGARQFRRRVIEALVGALHNCAESADQVIDVLRHGFQLAASAQCTEGRSVCKPACSNALVCPHVAGKEARKLK